MLQANFVSRLFAMCLLASALSAMAWTAAAFGQASQPSARPHILLPPSYGGTPLSMILHGHAALTAARGDLLESAANARLTDSIAAKQEMENSVEWVHTYFQRKEAHRQYTRSKTFIERQRERAEFKSVGSLEG